MFEYVRNRVYKLRERDGSLSDCTIVYYPISESYDLKGNLIKYPPSRVLVDVIDKDNPIVKKGGIDIREVKVKFIVS